jgi:hypothetical protein
MNDFECTNNRKLKERSQKPAAKIQRILVFQQNGSGEKKIEGIRRYGDGLFEIDIVSINASLPPIIDDADELIPQDIRTDLVLDYLKHPDLSFDLSMACQSKKIPVVASGKKLRVKGTLTPPT